MGSVRTIGLRTKLIAMIVFYTVAAFAMVSVFVNRQFQQMLLESYRNWVLLRTHQWAGHLRSQVGPDEALTGFKGKPRLLDQRSDFAHLAEAEEVAIYLTTGEQLFRIQPQPDSQRVAYLPRALEPDTIRQGGFADESGYAILMLLHPDNDGRLLCCRFPLPNGYEDLRSLYHNLLIICCVLALLAILLAIAADRAIVRPILTLTHAVIRTGKGDLDQIIHLETGDEMEVLARQYEELSLIHI